MNRNVISASLYKHYKGGLYYVIGEAKSTDDDLTEVVVYHALDEDGEMWVRNKEEFLSKVEDGVANPTGQQYRFELFTA